MTILVTSAFAVGDRVVLVDRPHADLHGRVVGVTEHALHVRYDDMHDHHADALIGRDGLRRLHIEGTEPGWRDPR